MEWLNIIVAILTALTCAGVAIVVENRQCREYNLGVLEVKQRQFIEASSRIDALDAAGARPWARPERIEPWTPAERAAFGIDETETFIAETEQILKGLEWDRETAAIRRNGHVKPTITVDELLGRA